MLRFNQIRLPGYLATWLLAIFSLFLAGCAHDLERLNQTLHAINTGAPLPSQNSGAPSQSMAQSAEAAQGTPTQLIIPNDKSVAAAMDAAMPNIKKVIALNRCMKSGDNMRMLNFHAVTGRNFGDIGNSYSYPNRIDEMRYHDRNKCVAARTMDQWSMPALNALRFRVVYFAEDSGETVNFQYEFKRVEDGSWKLDSLRRL